MSASSFDGVQNVPSDARQRQTPSLDPHSSHFLYLRHSPSTGYGVFATQSMEANTQLLESDGPAAYVIYRAFRKEVCAWCFRYERGRNWKIRFPSETTSESGATGIVFCSEQCREAWRDKYGEVAVEAFKAVEGLVSKQAKNKGWAIELYPESDESVPNPEEVDEAWRAAEEQAILIRAFRQVKPLSPQDAGCQMNSLSRPSKLQRQAFAKATSLPMLNTDMLFFLLSGILCAASVHDSSEWHTLLMLNPSLHVVYPRTELLREITTIFLHLTAVLPSSLLPFLTRETLEALLARDIGNSFGIWSTTTKPVSDSNYLDRKQGYENQEGAEMLGYGIWPIASFFNHSCEPNVSRHRDGRHWEFFSARNIMKGEELCISYIRGEEDTLSFNERQKRLDDAWGFTCRCTKCLREEEAEMS